MKVKLTYTNGMTKVLTFDNNHELNWFVLNEGDHLLHYRIIKNE